MNAYPIGGRVISDEGDTGTVVDSTAHIMCAVLDGISGPALCVYGISRERWLLVS